MKVYNDNQLYKSPAGDQLWNSCRQNWIFARIGDQEGAISDLLLDTFNLTQEYRFYTPPSAHK